MALQTQKEPLRQSAFETDEYESEEKVSRTRSSSSKKKTSKPLTPVKIALCVFACVAALVSGRYLRSNTTLFVEHRTLNGYLPFEEYVLNYSDTGNPVQNPRSFKLDDYYVHSGYNSGYETSRGTHVGDSWDQFVDAYGDMTIYNVYQYRYKSDGFIDWDYDSTYYDETLTVREFDEKYIKTGQVDLEQDGLSIDFRVETDGIKLYYTQDEMYNYYSNHRGILPGDTKRIYLNFEFMPEIVTGQPGLTLDSLSSTNY